MHELAVTQNILDLALRHAREAGASRVTDLYLVVGELSSVVDDSVRLYWDFVSEGTMAAGAALHFRRVPASFRCQACGRHFSPREDLACPDCHCLCIDVLAGEEFHLEALDVARASNEVAP